MKKIEEYCEKNVEFKLLEEIQYYFLKKIIGTDNIKLPSLLSFLIFKLSFFKLLFAWILSLLSFDLYLTSI
jgi:hypothetical protein